MREYEAPMKITKLHLSLLQPLSRVVDIERSTPKLFVIQDSGLRDSLVLLIYQLLLDVCECGAQSGR